MPVYRSSCSSSLYGVFKWCQITIGLRAVIVWMNIKCILSQNSPMCNKRSHRFLLPSLLEYFMCLFKHPSFPLSLKPQPPPCVPKNSSFYSKYCYSDLFIFLSMMFILMLTAALRSLVYCYKWYPQLECDLFTLVQEPRSVFPLGVFDDRSNLFQTQARTRAILSKWPSRPSLSHPLLPL